MATLASVFVPARLVRVEKTTKAMAITPASTGVDLRPSRGATNGAAPAATALIVENSAQP